MRRCFGPPTWHLGNVQREVDKSTPSLHGCYPPVRLTHCHFRGARLGGCGCVHGMDPGPGFPGSNLRSVHCWSFQIPSVRLEWRLEVQCFLLDPLQVLYSEQRLTVRRRRFQHSVQTINPHDHLPFRILVQLLFQLLFPLLFRLPVQLLLQLLFRLLVLLLLQLLFRLRFLQFEHRSNDQYYDLLSYSGHGLYGLLVHRRLFLDVTQIQGDLAFDYLVLDLELQQGGRARGLQEAAVDDAAARSGGG